MSFKKGCIPWNKGKTGVYSTDSLLKMSLGKKKCGSQGGKIRGCHWANISGEYMRDLSDWKSLCPKCNKNDNIKIHSRFKNEIRRNFI